MIGLLRRAAAERGSQDAVVTSRGSTSFAELLEWTENAAANLSAQGISRFAILDDEPARVLALVAASSLTGIEACVYPLAATDGAVAELRERFDHKHIVTSRATVTGSGRIDAAGILSDQGNPKVGSAPTPATLLVMTTGTSGHPQAVRHDWARLLRVATRISPTPDQRWLLAYGLNQFGGLQILIHVVAAQATLVAADSFQPRDGLDAMRRWSVTHASGTPTFWRFLMIEMQGDGGPTPPLRQVTMGGEAVPSALLLRVAERFPTARISQIYGATEFGQNVTVRDGIAGLPISMLEEGGDVTFKVVDGELWVRSKAAMLGYYDGDPVDAEAWRATGDLVEVVGERIEFRGRKSEVINVGGVKVHPLPIEDRIGRVPGVALVHAFGRKSALVGSIVAVEVVLSPGHDADDVDARIREACADLPPAARPRSMRFVDTMATTGNKLTRSSAK